MKITLRPYAKDKSRWTIDIRFMNPCTQDQEVRRRYVAPAGLDEKQARAWGERKVPTLLRELVGNAGERDAVPAMPAVVATPRKESATTKPTQTKPKTLAQFYHERFEPEHVALLKRATRDYYRKVWKTHIAPALGNMPLVAIDDDRLATFRAGLCKHLAATTANIVLSKVMKMLRFARRVRAITAVPSSERLPEPRKRPKAVYSDAQIAELVATAKRHGADVLVILLLGLEVGLRVSEICALEWGDIDLREGTVLVQRSVYQGEAQTPKGKIGKIALTKALHAALLAHDAEGRHGPLVVYRKSSHTIGAWTPHTPGSIRYLLHKVLDAVGLKRNGPHLLRHTALTRLANLGASVFIIQAVARHIHIQTTQVYLHTQQTGLSREAATLLDQASANALGNAFGNALATPAIQVQSLA